MNFHDVTNIEIGEPTSSNGHSWTTMVITHRVHGRDEHGEFAEVTMTTTIALHHEDGFHGTLPFTREGEQRDTVL